MIGVGWLGRKRRVDDSLADFYLGGRSIGLVVLFLTLYATQYSGNTLFGYTGKAYRIGFDWTVSILFMLSIIIGYLLFAPRLVRLSRLRQFITPGDFISFRFGSPLLTLLSTAVMIYALANYTLAQLKAMGAAVEGLSDGAVPSAYGIIALALIMVVYETLGGMRSVAWTDVQTGPGAADRFRHPACGSSLIWAGGIKSVVEQLSRSDPAMVEVPTLEACGTWVSYIFLLGFGAAIYPQAIQRLYAARSVRSVKRSLSVMAFMPLVTTLIALLCGVTGAVVLPDLAASDIDQVLPRLCALVDGTVSVRLLARRRRLRCRPGRL